MFSKIKQIIKNYKLQKRQRQFIDAKLEALTDHGYFDRVARG